MLRSNIIPFESKRDRAFSESNSNTNNNSSQDISEEGSTHGSSSNLTKCRSGEISLYASLDSDKPLSSFAHNKSYRGIAEDVAWLCLIDLSMALEFMHKKGSFVYLYSLTWFFDNYIVIVETCKILNCFLIIFISTRYGSYGSSARQLLSDHHGGVV